MVFDPGGNPLGDITIPNNDNYIFLHRFSLPPLSHPLLAVPFGAQPLTYDTLSARPPSFCLSLL